MKILLLTRYARLGASSRMRSYQYIPSLESANISVDAAPLFSDKYVQNIQEDKRNLWDIVSAYTQRLRRMLTGSNYDLLWIEKELLPWLPAWIERVIRPNGTPFVIDYDDAVFHYYDQHRSRIIRSLLGQKHASLIRDAEMVFAGNSYLAQYARSAGAKETHLVPTVIDLDRYPPPSYERHGSAPCIGWIGQRATASFLNPLLPLFLKLKGEMQLRVHAVGIHTDALGFPMSWEPWSEASEVAALARFDIGVMPLVDEPFERGKCGYKLIQYMAAGIPVVASPVGVNSHLVQHGVNGFLASTSSEWDSALRTLLGDASLRVRMGAAGRALVEREYCLQVTAPRIIQYLRQAAERRGR